MRGYTENTCPNCGNTVLIPNDRKTGVCMSCGEFVGNDGWYGYAQGKNWGCMETLGLIGLLIGMPFLLISCFL